MISLSIPTIFPSTNFMFGKYSADSALTVSLPVQTNASSMSLPVNTSDICCHPKALLWPHTKSKSSKIGQSLEKSRILIFPRLCQLLPSFHLWIFGNHSSAHASYLQGYPL